MVKLRLKRFGKKREASYRIVAIDSRARRQGRPIEELGYYNPRTKETILKVAEIAKWLRQGAQPSDTLDALLKKARIYEMVKSGVEISSEPITIASSEKVQTSVAVAEAPAVEAPVAVEEPVAAASTAEEEGVETSASEADTESNADTDTAEAPVVEAEAAVETEVTEEAAATP